MVFRWLPHFPISMSPAHFIFRKSLFFSFKPFWKHPDRCTLSCVSWVILNAVKLTRKINHHTYRYRKHMLVFLFNLVVPFWQPQSSSILFCYSVQQVPTIIKQSYVQVAFPFDEYFQIECEAKGNPEPK